MLIIVLVIHVLIAVALVGVILLQRSEGGALGIGGGGGGIMSGRAAGNVLTKSTAFLGASFMATSIALAILAGRDGGASSILDEPAPVFEESLPAEPEEPSGPSVPLRR